MSRRETARVAVVAGLMGVALLLVSCAGGAGGSRPSSPPVAASGLRSAATDGLMALAPSLANGRHRLYKVYSAKGDAVWSGGAVSSLDLSGVAFDQKQTATLITPRHVLMAKHYVRPLGSKLVFHDHSGGYHEAFLVAIRKGPNDIAVGQLNLPVPLRPYRVLSPRSDYGSLLQGAPVLVTSRQRLVFCHTIKEITEPGWVRFGASSVPGVAGKLTTGDSGNPSFLLVNGEPVLIETHTFGGFGGGPFLSHPSNLATIHRLIGEMGGKERLSMLTVR